MGFSAAAGVNANRVGPRAARLERAGWYRACEAGTAGQEEMDGQGRKGGRHLSPVSTERERAGQATRSGGGDRGRRAEGG